jgi:hypothetical protein
MSFLPYVPTNTKARMLDTVTSNSNSYVVANDQSIILSLTLNAIRSVLLPASPFDNQTVVIIDEANSAGTYNITISANSKTFDTGSSSLYITKNKGVVGFTYNLSESKWKIWIDSYNSNGMIEPIEVSGTTYIVGMNSVLLSMTSLLARSITLPSSPLHGQNVIVIDTNGAAGTNNITINGNGRTFDTGESSLVVCKTKGIAGFIFNATSNKWNVYINDYGSTGNDNYYVRDITSDGNLTANTVHSIDTSVPRTLSLPSGTPGAFVVLQDKTRQGGQVTINRAGSDTIMGDTSLVINGTDWGLTLVFAGTDWRIL